MFPFDTTFGNFFLSVYYLPSMKYGIYRDKSFSKRELKHLIDFYTKRSMHAWRASGSLCASMLCGWFTYTAEKYFPTSGLRLSASAAKIWSLNITHSSLWKVTAPLCPETSRRQLGEQQWSSCELKIWTCLRVLSSKFSNISIQIDYRVEISFFNDFTTQKWWHSTMFNRDIWKKKPWQYSTTCLFF